MRRKIRGRRAGFDPVSFLRWAYSPAGWSVSGRQKVYKARGRKAKK